VYREVYLLDCEGRDKSKLRRNWKIVSLVVIALVTSTVALVEYRRIYIFKDRLDCVASWLDQANALHTAQMKEPANITGDTMRQLMDSVDGAYDCATKEPSHSRIAPGGRAFGEHGVQPH
jgi:hypothetical protein